MRLMKKDMGGAAHALALARLIMGARLPVRLHMLIPAVENAVSGNAFRPGDMLRSRKGLTVEIDNTDAEGRLVLGRRADQGRPRTEPELILDFATLTGAARIALGPDLPALFANDDELADAMLGAAGTVTDPIWRMPLWDGYDEMLKCDIADLSQRGATRRWPGAVTAALFLRRFVPKDAMGASRHLRLAAGGQARAAQRAAKRWACAPRSQMLQERYRATDERDSGFCRICGKSCPHATNDA